jgi:hypothetical protein
VVHIAAIPDIEHNAPHTVFIGLGRIVASEIEVPILLVNLV